MTSNWIIEAAEERVVAETERLVARVSGALDHPGSEICVDCGEPIPERRRQAAPFATRCIDCQTDRDDMLHG